MRMTAAELGWGIREFTDLPTSEYVNPPISHEAAERLSEKLIISFTNELVLLIN